MDNLETTDRLLSIWLVLLDITVAGIVSFIMSFEVMFYLFDVENIISESYDLIFIILIIISLLDLSLTGLFSKRIIKIEKRGLIFLSFFSFSLVVTVFFAAVELLI